MKAAGYVKRVEFIEALVRGRRVLDCGFVGLTCVGDEHRVAGFEQSLHWRIAGSARETYGIDHSQATVDELRQRYPALSLVAGRIEEADQLLAGEPPFEVVVLGDIVEHVSNAGLALDAVRRLLVDGGQVVVSCPNAFGLPNYLRFLTGRYREGEDHVAAYSKYTLGNLLKRHGFTPERILTALDHRPETRLRMWLYGLGAPAFRVLPELGGTLLIVARKSAAR